MMEDPIVSEVRATREKLAARFDFDVKAIFADLRADKPRWVNDWSHARRQVSKSKDRCRPPSP